MAQSALRVAIYARVSTADQSNDRQIADLAAFAERAGHQVVATFVETASGADDRRPERRKAIELAKRREVDAIAVTELSRWGRSTADLISTLTDLHGNKVSLLALNGQSFDLATATGKLMVGILATLAQFERDLIRERVMSGLAVAWAEGKKSGRRPGFRPSDKKASKVLKMRGEGYSLRSIAKHLRMSPMTVQAVLKRQAAAAA